LEQKTSSRALFPQRILMQVGRDREKPRSDLFSIQYLRKTPGDTKPGFLEQVFRLSPVPCQVEGETENGGSVRVIQCIELLLAHMVCIRSHHQRRMKTKKVLGKFYFFL
jgi:hypothetical protein